MNKYFKGERLAQKAMTLKKDCDRSTSVETLLDTVFACRKFSLVQKRSEILRFLELVQKLKPKTICDIGSSGGGTLRLFSHLADDAARIISIDLNNTPVRQKAFRQLIKPSQEISIIEASSYAQDTINKVKALLGQRSIDLLFIDGDHSYDGVSKDYYLYSPFVRPGGIVGFHDIVPDFKTRFGVETASYVGEVPQFWSEVKATEPNTLEFIDDPAQDGYGIGVVIK